MVDFIIAGHGRFASGIKSGIQMIFGPVDALDTVELRPDETKTELDAKMSEAIGRHADATGIIVFCDLLQGSPFQSAAAHAQTDARIRVVYGTNQAMVIECLTLAMAGDRADVDALAAKAVETGRKLIGVFCASSTNDDGDDDDW